MKHGELDRYFNQELQDLVTRFEEMLKADDRCFFEESSLERLIDYYEMDDKIELAMEAANLGTELFPFSARFYLKTAQLLFNLKKIDGAIEALDQAQLHDPREMEIFLLRADINVWLSQHQDAIDVLNEAIATLDHTEKEDIYLEIADVFEDWEKYDKVIEYLKGVLHINPKNEEALGRIWFCVELTETYQDSVEFHSSLLDEEPYSYMAWFNLGHAYSGQKNHEKAIEAFEFAIAINDKYDHAYRDCGEILLEIGDYKKASECFIQASLLSKPTKELYFNIGICFENLKNYNRARYYFRKATTVDPHFDKAFFKIGENYKRENRWPQAVPSFERAVKLNSKNSAYLDAMGEGYSNIGRLDDAISAYQRAVELAPAEQSNWLQLAKVLFLSGEFRRAISFLDEAATRFDNNAEIHFLQSAYQYQIGNRRDAVRNLDKGLNKDVNGYDLTFEVTPYMKNDPAIIQILKKHARS